MIFVRCFDEAKRVQNFMNGVENGLGIPIRYAFVYLILYRGTLYQTALEGSKTPCMLKVHTSQPRWCIKQGVQ